MRVIGHIPHCHSFFTTLILTPAEGLAMEESAAGEPEAAAEEPPKEEPASKEPPKKEKPSKEEAAAEKTPKEAERPQKEEPAAKTTTTTAEDALKEPPAPAAEEATGDGEAVKSKEEPFPKRVKVWSVIPSEGVDLAIEKEGLPSMKPTTVGEMFQETYQKYPNRDGLCFKTSRDAPEWERVSFSQYYANCLAAAKSFKKVSCVCYMCQCVCVPPFVICS